ncbi:hypothetical protein Cni_G03553 [Canna indica]|uniref:Uncharacterized protein n=1 Tax=Canna indica TaxID=4628 RepID=A0AAQ3JRC9_9LILI|nr:hypothetical protein Cni_G03553 [Canna indica]
MEIVLLSDHFLRLSPPPLPRFYPSARFNPLSRKDHCFPCRRCRNWKPVAVSCSVSASASPNPSMYGGWDDPELLDESYRSRMLDSISNLLASLGITERKHGFLFVLGFLSALMVSRVRVSSMAVLPISVVIFAVGFSAGVTRADVASGSIWDFDEKLKDLRDFLKDLDDKILYLKNGLEEGVESNRLRKSKLKNYVEVVECMRLRIWHAQKTVEGFSSGDSVDQVVNYEQGGKKSGQKPSRKRKELRMIAYDLVRLFGSLLQENITGLKLSNGKDAINKVELREKVESTAESSTLTELRASSVIVENNLGTSGTNLDGSKGEKSEVFLEGLERGAPDVLKVKIVADQGVGSVMAGKKFNSSGSQRYGDNISSYDEDLDNLNASFHFMTRQEHYQKMVFRHQYDHMMQNELHNSADGKANQKAAKSMDYLSKSAESSLLEQRVEVHDRSYLHSHEHNGNKLKDELESSNDFVDQFQNDRNDLKVKPDYQSAQDPTTGVREGRATSSSSSPSSMASADDEFNQSVKEASELLRKARVYMKSQADEAEADTLLYRSAKLLSTAVSLKPMSLLAIGQLGNTYLLHGELKLKISRELRALLSKSDANLNEKIRVLRLKKLDVQILRRENVASVLTDVCEECEELLVEAGRKYRTALTIDQSDVRALYNWGLALSYRAQLIADIGPEAAADADKVYMAAIDKFDAIVSRNNTYAPDALYRWGVALQQRSQLRRNNRGEKLKLLQQAKSLFEDVLYVESNNQLAREALSSCLLELNYHGKW